MDEQNEQQTNSNTHTDICVLFIFRYLCCGRVLDAKWNWMYYFVFIFRYITSFLVIVSIACVFWIRIDNIDSNVIDNDLISVFIISLIIFIPLVSLFVNIFHFRNAIVATFTVTPDRTATELIMTGMAHEINDLLLFSRNDDSIKIDLNKRDYQNRTPVIFAANFGDVEGLRRLLKQGADFTQHGSSCSPLTMAALCNYTECVEFLLDEVPGYDVNEIDPQGETALTITCIKNSNLKNEFATDAMLLLLDKYKVDVNSRNKSGDTALINACDQGHLQGVKILLSKYNDVIDINVKNNDGWTAFASATFEGYTDIMKLLLETNKLDNDAINDAFVSGFGSSKSLDGPTYLMKHYNVSVDCTDYDGYSALIRAIEDQDKNKIDLLLSDEYIDKIDIYTKNRWDATALGFAVYQSNIGVIEKLLTIHSNNSNSQHDNSNYINNAFAQGAYLIQTNSTYSNDEQLWNGMKYLINHCDIDVNTVYVCGHFFQIVIVLMVTVA